MKNDVIHSNIPDNRETIHDIVTKENIFNIANNAEDLGKNCWR